MTPSNKKLIRSRFASNLHSYNQHATVQEAVCERLAGILSSSLPDPPAVALEIGAGTGFLTKHLLKRYPHAKWFINDIVPGSKTFIDPLVQSQWVSYLFEDAEEMYFPRSLDLIATASTIQWFDDLGGFFKKSHDALNLGGMIVLSAFGRENFKEITHAAGEGLDYPSLDDLEACASACGFTTVHKEEYLHPLLFDSPTEVLRHIKLTGVNGIRSVAWNKRILEEFCAVYSNCFSTDNGNVRLTYHPIIYVGRK